MKGVFRKCPTITARLTFWSGVNESVHFSVRWCVQCQSNMGLTTCENQYENGKFDPL